VLATRTLPNTAQVRTANPWEDLQDPLVIMDFCQILLDGFRKDFSQIAGIGLTGQMHGIVYVDQKGRAASNLATWQDGRGDLDFGDGVTYANYLRNTTGYAMATGYGLTTHFYLLQHGLVPEDAVTFCTIADYIGMRLTGGSTPMMHASNAHSLGMFDLRTLQFDHDAIARAGIDPAMLPEITQRETTIGETADGIPVSAAIGDNQASFLGAVGQKSNLLVNIGTSSQLSVRSKRLVKAEGLDVRPYVQGEYLLVGAGLCGGSAYMLLRDLFREGLGLYGIDAGEELYAKMEAAAKSAIRSEYPLIVDTRFRGTRTAPDVRGAIMEIGMDNLTIGQLALGLMRGICEELFNFYQQIPEELKEGVALTGSGNALRRNATLRMVLAERFGMELNMPDCDEGGAAGAAALAQIRM
jgi:sedoheptulokinase